MTPYQPPGAMAQGGPPPGQAHPGQPGLARSRCQLCGRQAPVKAVTFMQNVGVLIIRFPRTVKGMLCKRCISSCFWKMTTITLFFGWWGIISFFYSLVSIPSNIANYLGASSLPDE
jgi:hypothetical protein